MATISERPLHVHDDETLIPPELDAILDDDELWAESDRLAALDQSLRIDAVAASDVPAWPDGLMLFDDLDTITAGLAQEARERGLVSDRAWREAHAANTLASAYGLLYDGYVSAAIKLADSQARVKTLEALLSDCHD